MGGAPVEKFAALGGHFLAILLTHGAPQDIRFSEGKAGHPIDDLHHLFLIQDDAIRFFQNVTQLWQFVGNLLPAMLAVDEIVHHAALYGAGAVGR